jgi:hypothetical protein
MTKLAQRCFTENLHLIGKTPAGSPQDPIAWNLNQGLLDLAREIAKLQSDVQQLQHEMRAMRQR